MSHHDDDLTAYAREFRDRLFSPERLDPMAATANALAEMIAVDAKTIATEKLSSHTRIAACNRVRRVLAAYVGGSTKTLPANALLLLCEQAAGFPTDPNHATDPPEMIARISLGVAHRFSRLFPEFHWSVFDGDEPARELVELVAAWRGDGEGRWAVSTRALLAMGISKLSNERSLAMAWQRAKDGTGRSRRVPQRNSHAKKKQ